MEDTIRAFIREHLEAVQRLDATHRQQLAAAATLINTCLQADGAVYICGNGGSAADAQHIAAELAGRFLRERRALRCVALTTNASALTAIGNDYDFDRVFARQLEGLARPGDVLWAISTSGRSRNVLAAARVARQCGARVLGFTGGSGGALAALCDVCFVAPVETAYGIQQLHQLAYHIICDLVERQAGARPQ